MSLLLGAVAASGSLQAQLTSSLLTLSGQSASWSFYNFSAPSNLLNKPVRMVLRYARGTSFTGDIQIDYPFYNGSYYSFEGGNDGWETHSAFVTDYNSVSWASVVTGSSLARWNRDSGGTPSGSTGLTFAYAGSWYLYAETSGGSTGSLHWARSPQFILNNTSMGLAVARSGATIGTLTVHLAYEE
jgi:hypothetical protein